MELAEMNIIIKLFSLTYALLMVLMILLGLIWTLTAIFTPKWANGKALLMKYKNSKSA